MRQGLPLVLAAGAFVVAMGALLYFGGSDAPPAFDADGLQLSATCVRGPTPTPMPTYAAGKRPLSTPDLRPDSTRMAEIDGFRKRRYESTKALIDSGCDPRGFPQVVIGSVDGYFPRTFDEAVQRADSIITAHVIGTTFEMYANPDSGVIPTTRTTLAVDLTLKGAVSQQVTLYEAAGPMPDFGGIIGGIWPGDPVLFSGGHVLLLGQKRTEWDGYWSMPRLGEYYIEHGVLRVPDGNPCDWLTGRSVDDAIAMIRKSLLRKTSEDPLTTPACDWTRE